MKKIFPGTIVVLILTCILALLAACGETQKTTKPTKTNSYKDSEIYQVYLAYAENGGKLSYDEWYASIKGEKGDKGDKGDTGVKGDKGDQGIQGEKGEKGEDGLTPTIEINADGYWVINGEVTTVKAQGEEGEKGDKGDKGEQGIQGQKGDKGDKGDNGLTPYIGENGNWWIGEEDTGTKASSGEEKGVFFTGKCGENATWTMYIDGSLIISGQGEITSTPWSSFSALITKATIEDGIENIPNYAFRYCSSLTSITIPDSVTSIGEWAFSGCSSLTSVTIPDSVTSIGDSAFRYCDNLTSITLGNGVTSIGDRAFDDCSRLTSVYYTGDIASWCGITFGYFYFSNPLEYAHNLYIDNELIKDIVIPDTVTEIKAYAFRG